MGFSWAVISISSVFVLNKFEPEPDLQKLSGLPSLSGMALTGMRLYGSLGCVACHTQQVRQLSLTPTDVARLWGQRGSLVQDTLLQPVYFSGSMRIGPDLSNYALRQKNPMAVHELLYAPREAGMPSYTFLYRVQKIQGTKSKRALDLPRYFCPPSGYEIVPTYEAECLVAYLLSLKTNH